jgi:hypothetical protein
MVFDAEFWERVLITFLGATIPLLIFIVTWLRDRRRTRKERRAELLSQFSDELGELLVFFVNTTYDEAGERRLRDAVLKWTATSIRFRVTLGSSPIIRDFEETSNALGRWVYDSPVAFVEARGSNKADAVIKPIGAVAQQLLELQHKVNVLVVRETVGPRESKRVEGEKPVLNDKPLLLGSSGTQANGWQVVKLG